MNMKCPVCKDITLLMMDKNWIEIDYCPECRWVWLDRWELEKLIQWERIYNKESDTHDHWEYQNNSNYDYKGRKKKSFLEAFDFFD